MDRRGSAGGAASHGGSGTVRHSTGELRGVLPRNIAERFPFKSDGKLPHSKSGCAARFRQLLRHDPQ